MTKISDLTALTGAGVDSTSDLLPIVDMSAAGAARNKKITVDEARIGLGLGTAASPQFTGINLGHASDTTITRASAGVVAIEGVNIVTTAGGVTFAADIIVPDEAYDATAWNASLEVPTKNAVRDKIEDILDGVTFTGDIVVPDEAYDATAWNGSLEVPTKNAVRDKIESLSGGSFTAASTTEVLTGTDSSKGATPDAIAALWEQGSDVASAGTTSLGEGGYFNITGTTTITDIDFATDKAGRKAWVKFAGALTLTHNASTLILPTGANITTAAGDTACFISEGTDAVRCVAYQRASGAALTGGSSGGYEGGPVTAATTTDLGTWVNQGTSTVTDGTGALILKPQVDGLVHAREKTIAGSFTYYMKLDFDFLSTAAVTAAITGVAGVFLRDSSDSEIIVLGLYYERISGDEQNLYGAIIQRWTNATTFSASPVLKYNNKPWKWLKVDSNGTTLTFSVGHDGKNFTQVGTETIATFIDTVDRIGVGAIASANMTEAVVTVPYFSTTAPS